MFRSRRTRARVGAVLMGVSLAGAGLLPSTALAAPSDPSDASPSACSSATSATASTATTSLVKPVHDDKGKHKGKHKNKKAPRKSVPMEFAPVGAMTSFSSMAGGPGDSVYISGSFADVAVGVHLLEGSRLTTVELPGAHGGGRLMQINGGVYAIADGALFQLEGQTAVKIDIPAQIGTVYPGRVYAAGSDGSCGLWIATELSSLTPYHQRMTYHYSPGAVNFVHFDGQSWSGFTSDFGYGANVRTPVLFSLNDLLYADITRPGKTHGEADVRRWDGAAWTQVGWTFRGEANGYGYRNDTPWVTQSKSTYLAGWGGVARPLAAVAQGANADAEGLCQVYSADPGVGCVAPIWPVSAAASLTDGRILLGGADTMYGRNAAAPAGFAIVPFPGAEPVTVPGDNGAFVVALTGNLSSTRAWAVTSNEAGGGLTLQRAILDGRGGRHVKGESLR